MTASRYTEDDFYPQIPHLGYKGEIGDLREDTSRAFNRVAGETKSLHLAHFDSEEDMKDLLGSAMSGDMELVTSAAEDVSIGGRGLNTAEPEDIVLWFEVDLMNTEAMVRLHDWFKSACTVVVNSTFADGVPPSDPLIKYMSIIDQVTKEPEWFDEDPRFEFGKNLIAVVLDTNTVALEKVYTIGDKIDVVIGANAADEIMGYSVPAVTKTFNFVV